MSEAAHKPNLDPAHLGIADVGVRTLQVIMADEAHMHGFKVVKSAYGTGIVVLRDDRNNQFKVEITAGPFV